MDHYRYEPIMKRLQNQEILKKPIIKKITNVKKINLEMFSVLPDAWFEKEPKKSQKLSKNAKCVNCAIWYSFRRG